MSHKHASMKWKHTGESSTIDFVATARSILGFSVEGKAWQILETWKESMS